MFWILRRTRFANSAAALLNNLNNNNNNNNNEPRPARKAYNKLGEKDEKIKLSSANGEKLDNTESSAYNCDAGKKDSCRIMNGNNVGNESDSDSSFTDIEIDDFSDSDYDEALTCNVCDRSFSCPKQLALHKQKKRHFGCSGCDSLFTTLMALEHHKEEFEHWSGDEDFCSDSDEDDDEDIVISEECERLIL